MYKKFFILFIMFIICYSKHVFAITGNYSVGDSIKYNGTDFWVLNDTNDSITLLKSQVLNIDEIDEEYKRIARIDNCVRIPYGTDSNYDTSIIKQVVDKWGEKYFNYDELIEDSFGYKIRLITLEEYDRIKNNLDVRIDCWYWTMTGLDNYENALNVVAKNEISGQFSYYDNGFSIRPVITIKKENTDLIEIDAEEADNDLNGEIINNQNNSDVSMNNYNSININNNQNANEKSNIVKVPNTMLSEPFISTFIGGLLLVTTIIASIIIINFKTRRN